MRRRNGSGCLRRGGGMAPEEINPMEGMANMADVMLVFVCGLLLALITFWNVDVAGMAVSVEQGQEVGDMAGLEGENGPPLENSALEQYGTVYRDPATGKLYMVTEE